MVFPAHLSSGGKLLLADLPDEQLEAIYAEEKWRDRAEERPDLGALRRELGLVREREFAINAERTEAGVTAVGRALRAGGGPAVAAISLSMPSMRFTSDRLTQLVAALAVTARDIERDLAAGLHE